MRRKCERQKMKKYEEVNGMENEKVKKVKKPMKQLLLKVTPEQWEMIQIKMAQMGTTKFSPYARKMLIDGYVFRRDYSELKELTHALASAARSLNQIALRANETRSIYAGDVEDIRRQFLNMKRAVTERLVKMTEEE